MVCCERANSKKSNQTELLSSLTNALSNRDQQQSTKPFILRITGVSCNHKQQNGRGQERNNGNGQERNRGVANAANGTGTGESLTRQTGQASKPKGQK